MIATPKTHLVHLIILAGLNACAWRRVDVPRDAEVLAVQLDEESWVKGLVEHEGHLRLKHVRVAR